MNPLRLTVDTDEIERFVNLLFRPGELVELRILKPRGIASGYFNDPDALAAAAAEWNEQGNVYFTLNEPHAECIHRAENTVRGYTRESTSDREIVRRRLLLIDIDSQRPVSGIAATDQELQAALQCAERLRYFLGKMGWPAPLYGSSGNGGQLLYRVDLPADDGGIVAGVLQSLATEFSGSGVKVDTTVHNAARISRMFGTMNRKGDSTAERPHRLAEIIDAPESLEIVPRELLERLAGQRAASAPQPSTSPTPYDVFDLKGFLDSHGLEYREKDKEKYGKMYELRTCPFIPHDTEFKSAVWLWDGLPCFKCQSDKCDGLGWADFRNLIAPKREAAPAGQPSPALESHDDPHRLARIFLERYQHPDAPRYCYFAGAPYVWQDGAWARQDQADIDLELTAAIKAEFDRLGPIVGKKNKTLAKVTKGVIGNTANALNSLRRQPKGEQPFWIGNDAWPANEILACSDGLIHLPSYVAGEPDYMRPLTPRFFSTLNLGYPFKANGPEPRRWLDFLNQLWPDDPDSIALLQEYGGYLITLDNQYQSALMMRGPKRAGKGTICRIWEAMLGRDNVTATSLSALGEPHGLQNLIGKSFAVMGDERIGRRTDRTASVRNLLGIIGNDLVYVNPKYGAPFDCRLNVRFAIVTNELLDLPDTAGALAARLLVLRLSQSFAGREDRNLEPELLKELPGILRWHIAGWARLRKQGKFTQPASGAELLDEFADANNPIGAFIKACCILGPDNWTESQELYGAYRQWCESTGRTCCVESQFFRELSTAAPEVRQSRPRRGEFRQRGYTGIGLANPEPCRLILPMGTAATWVEELFAEYIANPPPIPQDLLAYAKGA